MTKKSLLSFEFNDTINGIKGNVEVYDDKIIIKREGNQAKFVIQGLSKEVIIYFDKLNGINYEEASILKFGVGRINFEVGSLFNVNNSIPFHFTRKKEFLKHYEEIREIFDNYKTNDNKKNNSSNLDELKKLKELLDMGAISQEEYDKKKEELLK